MEPKVMEPKVMEAKVMEGKSVDSKTSDAKKSDVNDGGRLLSLPEADACANSKRFLFFVSTIEIPSIVVFNTETHKFEIRAKTVGA